MEDPKTLDGSDTPAKQTQPPLLYTTFKKYLKNALIALEAFDQPSLAMLKHDDEFRDSVQRMLAKLTMAPLSELLEQAMKDSVQSIVSRLSAQIFPSPPLKNPFAPPPATVSSQPKTSISTPESTFSTSQPPALSGVVDLFQHSAPSNPNPPASPFIQASKLGQTGLVTSTGPSQSSTGTTQTVTKIPRSDDWLYPGAMATVYFIRLVLGEWVPDPMEGLKVCLNDQLQLERGSTIKDPFVLMTFMSKKRRPGIGLACHAHSASESVQMLAHLRKSVDAISDFLMFNRKDGDSYLVTELGVLSIASHSIRTVFP